MKCLEKDRSRRYETATGLATDLQRHLGNEPIVARPPSRTYRFQKMIRRNRGAACGAGAVVLALVLGAVISTWQAFEASSARDAAERERLRAGRGELLARQKGYASDMNLAQQALAEKNLGRAQFLLDRQRPSFGQRDLRGWEWPQLWYCLAQGNRLVIGDAPNQSLHEWDLTTWEEVGVWPAPTQLYSGTLSPDGRSCVTLGFDGASMINDFTTGRTRTGEFGIRSKP